MHTVDELAELYLLTYTLEEILDINDLTAHDVLVRLIELGLIDGEITPHEL